MTGGTNVGGAHSGGMDLQASEPESVTTEVNAVVARILIVGIVTAVVIIAVGLVITIVSDPTLRDPAAADSLRRGTEFTPHTPGDVWAQIRSLRGVGFTMAGIALLVATPVLRVAASIGAFARERDWRYVAITAAVLALLAAGTILGVAEQ